VLQLLHCRAVEQLLRRNENGVFPFHTLRLRVDNFADTGVGGSSFVYDDKYCSGRIYSRMSLSCVNGFMDGFLYTLLPKLIHNFSTPVRMNKVRLSD
jgi:hypothetical protein